MNMKSIAVWWSLVYFLVLTLVSGCAGNSAAPSVSLKTTCTHLNGATIDDVTITSTKWYDASGDNPAFCQVNATRPPYLDMEVDVPENWSGRLWHQGGGGLDGTITSAITTDPATGAITSTSIALKDGRSVYAASNGGNRSSVMAEAAPRVWADGTPEGVASAKDYAYTALLTTREFAKVVIHRFYGRSPAYTYFNGCSNGGRNAYIAADHWPEDYDGIVSGCMGMDLTGQTVGWLNLGAKSETPAMPNASQWQAVTDAAIAACDALDGVADGMIANQAACHFDVATLQCGEPTAPAACLTAQQVQTVKDVTSDLKLADTTTVYSGYTWADWYPHVVYFGMLGGGNAVLATGDPAWFSQTSKQQSFNLDDDCPLFQYSFRIIGAAPDKSKVAAFVASGRKLISWHDGSDNLTSFNDHVRNYSTMVNLATGLGLADPGTNTRFFVVPGGSHTDGAELTDVNWYKAITHWVENNIAPEQLLYNKRDKITREVLRTLPVCRHPQYPRYNGAGDVNAAASYTCTTP
jgi:feruloyl esterase